MEYGSGIEFLVNSRGICMVQFALPLSSQSKEKSPQMYTGIGAIYQVTKQSYLLLLGGEETFSGFAPLFAQPVIVQKAIYRCFMSKETPSISLYVQ